MHRLILTLLLSSAIAVPVVAQQKSDSGSREQQKRQNAAKQKHTPAATAADKSKADTKPDAKATPEKPPVRRLAVKLTREQEEVALDFAHQHHGELAKLLEHLREKSPTAFSRGIREVYYASQRINRAAERTPSRFDAELKKWKTDSEIKLLTAKYAMSQDPVLEDQIRSLLRSRQEARIDDLRAERDKLAQKLQELDQQIGMGNAELDAFIAEEFEKITKQAMSIAKARARERKTRLTKDRPQNETDE